MSYMVSYRGGDGKPGFHQTDELSSAIEHVEHLRNDEGVERAQIFKMEEVAFEFRPYFRVELGGATAAAAAAPMAASMPVAAPVEKSVSAEPVGGDESSDEGHDDGMAAAWPMPEDGASGPADAEPVGAARRGLFGR